MVRRIVTILKWFAVTLLVLLLLRIALWAVFPDISPEWVGFKTYTNDNNEIVSAKTLWDWLDLIIVGAVIAIGGILLNRSARANELRIAEQDRNQAALQAYYDKMADT